MSPFELLYFPPWKCTQREHLGPGGADPNTLLLGVVPTTYRRGDLHFLSSPGQHELNLLESLDPPLSNAATEPGARLFGSQTEASLGDSSLAPLCCQTSRSGLW